MSINCYKSNFLPITCGGSVIDPLLFYVYIYDLPFVLRHSKIHLSTDDVQIYTTRFHYSVAPKINISGNGVESLTKSKILKFSLIITNLGVLTSVILLVRYTAY